VSRLKLKAIQFCSKFLCYQALIHQTQVLVHQTLIAHKKSEIQQQQQNQSLNQSFWEETK